VLTKGGWPVRIELVTFIIIIRSRRYP